MALQCFMKKKFKSSYTTLYRTTYIDVNVDGNFLEEINI